MSIEQAMRERHAFEDRLRNFLILASIMTDREVEIALSRLVDMAAHMGAPPQVVFKGKVLASYLDIRRQNRRAHRPLKRALFRRLPGMPLFDGRIDQSNPDYWIRSIANFTLLAEYQLAPPAANNGQEIDETILLLAP